MKAYSTLVNFIFRQSITDALHNATYWKSCQRILFEAIETIYPRFI